MRSSHWIFVLWSAALLGGACSPEVKAPPTGGSGQAAPALATAPTPAPPHAGTPATPAGWTSLERGERPAIRPTPLTALLAQPESFRGYTVRTSGTVDVACPGGCWLQFGQGLPGGPVRVTLAGAEIKVPADCQGATLDVQGTLVLEELPIDRAQLLENERAESQGETPRAITAPFNQVVIQATGWSLSRSPERAAAPPATDVPPCQKPGEEPPPCARGAHAEDLLGTPR